MIYNVELIEDAIHEHVLADPYISDIIGTKLHWAFLPEKPKFPCILYSAVSQVQLPASHDGAMGWERGRFQFDLIGDCARDLLKLAYRLENRFRPNYTGVIGGPNHFAQVGYMQKTNRLSGGIDVALNMKRMITEITMLYKLSQ